MLAVIKTEKGPGADVREAEVPAVRPDEVLVKVSAAAICGTDLHIYDWDP